MTSRGRRQPSHPDVHEAAAIVTFLSPGLRFFHQGQFEGRRKRISPHLVRAPQEPVDAALQAFYEKLLACLKDPVFRDGQWQLLDAGPAWEGNESADAFIAFSWSAPVNLRRLVVANYASHSSQCYAKLPWGDLAGRIWRLHDRLGAATYDRDGADLATRGLYLDMPAWGYHVFEVQPVQATLPENRTRGSGSDS